MSPSLLLLFVLLMMVSVPIDRRGGRLSRLLRGEIRKTVKSVKRNPLNGQTAAREILLLYFNTKDRFNEKKLGPKNGHSRVGALVKWL